MTDARADIVCVGHTHWPLVTEIDGVRVVNVGSVSNALPPDLRASYVVIDATRDGVSVGHRRVEYDRDAVIDELRRVRHPAAGYISRCMRGENTPPWWWPGVPPSV